MNRHYLLAAEYLELTREMLNTIRIWDLPAMSRTDAEIWRQWLRIVEVSGLQPESPYCVPSEILFHRWSATHDALLHAALRLPVTLEEGERRRPGEILWAISRAARDRLVHLGLDLWTWHAARAKQLRVPFVTYAPPLSWDPDQAPAHGPVHCMETQLAAEEKRLGIQFGLPRLPEPLVEELWHLQQATGWSAAAVAKRAGAGAQTTALSLYFRNRQEAPRVTLEELQA